MADMTLCASKTCAVRERCKRNNACPQAYVWSTWRQSFARWHPEAGASCPGFVDANATTPPPSPSIRR